MRESRLLEYSALSLVLVSAGVGGFALYKSGIFAQPAAESQGIVSPISLEPAAPADLGQLPDLAEIPAEGEIEEAVPVALVVEEIIAVSENFEEIRTQSIERLGFVPEGGIPEDIASRMTPVLRLDPLHSGFLSPVALSSDKGRFRIDGVNAVDFSEVCIGSDGAEFSCYDWVMEGLDILVSSSRGLRCTVLEQAEEEGELSLASCESNIGGDWVDIATWSVENGLNMAASFETAALEDAARAAQRGLWSAFPSPEDDSVKNADDEDPEDLEDEVASDEAAPEDQD